ncbi:MAG: hypothetical protein AAGI88_22595 [Pseudomonadota bacterium]
MNARNSYLVAGNNGHCACHSDFNCQNCQGERPSARPHTGCSSAVNYFRHYLVAVATITTLFMGGIVGANPNEEGQNVMRVHYIEIVTKASDEQISLLEKVHGVEFGEPEADLGQARVAKLDSGTLLGVRSPLAEHEQPVTRTYYEVADIAAAVSAAEAAGGLVAYPPTQQGDSGTWAIYFLGEAQIGLWQR